MRAFGRSDTGRVRTSNQDAFICGNLPGDAMFAVVSDGMGGANGGNVASSIAIRVISDRILEVYREGMGETSLRHMLESAVSAANVEIFDAAMADTDLRGMGTTVVSLLVTGGQAHIAHVGDSRAYLAEQDGLRQITRDHSIVQSMVEKGQLTPEEARNHPRKHFITRALGVEEAVECEYNAFSFPPEGRLLLCTDGLTNMVETDDIDQIVRSSEVDDIPDQLISAANRAGGSDNITVVVVAP
ncbi:MAG: Stp1/IreP family PP2C-type Ser/Thr phosphatase [Clostridiales bacterium]|nr:Stp1/IreP family PP2C-type Ser/Thr phosphatase [Clostridiales bacterium]